MHKTKKNSVFSDIGFIFSLIGAAVGLGNIWRFPNTLAQDTGGAAFVIVYFIALLCIALPITLLEMNYGLFFRRGIIDIFRKTVPKFGRFIGWKQTLILCSIGLYYLVVLTWVGVSLASSIIPSVFSNWGKDANWFNTNILKSNASSLKFSWPILAGGLFFIVLIVVVLSFGIRSGLEKLNLIVVPSLFIGLIGLTIYTLTLKNASMGIDRIFHFKAENFKKISVWSQAIKQVVFSTGILMGILIVFSSSSSKFMDKGNQAFIVLLADTLIGFIAGIFVMGIIANQATNDVLKVEKFADKTQITAKMNELIKNQSGGPTLIFSFLPIFFYELGIKLDFPMFGQILMFIFMLTLLFAAISSLIALVEVFLNALENNFTFSRLKTLLIWSILAIGALILYSFSFGSKLIDLQDSLLLWLIVIIGVFETIFFPLCKQYAEIVKANDPYTFLKIGKFNWLKYTLWFLVTPLLLLIVAIDFLVIFSPWLNITISKEILTPIAYKSIQTSTIIISFSLIGIVFLSTLGLTCYQNYQVKKLH